jgi:ribokinase
MAYPVFIIGSFVQDLTWRTPVFPAPGQTVIGTFSTGPGGKGSNQAVAAGRAGAPIRYLGSVGDDAFGREAKAFYEAEGIAAHWLTQEVPTGTAGILVNEKGQNEIVVALGANAEFTLADLPDELWDGVEWLVSQLEIAPATVVALLTEARRRGIKTLLNPAPMSEAFPLELLGLADILLPNETEFIELCRRAFGEVPDLGQADTDDLPDGPTTHALCRRLGPETVVLTLGSRGAMISTPDDFWFEPARRDVKAVDTTGAGDAFVGGFVTALNETGGDLRAAVRFGTAVAALSVTRFGTAPSMPLRSEIDRFI